MSTITFTQTLEVSDQDCYDVLTTAAEGGYMEEFEILNLKRAEDLSVVELLVGPAEGCEHEDADGVTTLAVKIDANRVREGLKRYGDWVASSDPERKSYLGQQWGEVLDPECGPGYLDAIGADAVLQFAVFGEVVFG